MHKLHTLTAAFALACATLIAHAQVAVRAQTLHTAAGAPINDGVVLVDASGIIRAVGPFAGTLIPGGYELIEVPVATPGLVDVRATAGLTGPFNVDHDQDVLETSAPIQPELRASDAYNPRDALVAYLRAMGVTTIHTGHAPGELVSGTTTIVKTRGNTIDDAAIVRDFALTATLSPDAHRSGGNPGTRGKAYSMLRAELLAAQEHADKVDAASDDDEADPPSRDLRKEALAKALAGEIPFIVTANRAQDIASALRLADEFGLNLWLDMAAEAHVMLDEIREANVPVLLHPTQYRAWGESANLSWATAKTLADAGVPFAIQSGYEAYVPKVRVVLFEAAVAAGPGGLGFDRALRSITINAARILGIDDTVGSLEVGKQGDLALYSGDPFEYTTTCLGTVIDGQRFAGEADYDIGYPAPASR